MQNRYQKFFAPVYLLVLLLSWDALAQFNKYRSRSRFNTNDANSMTAQPNSPQKPMDLDSQNDLEMMDPADAAIVESSDDNFSEPDEMEDEDETPGREDDANRTTFGARVTAPTMTADARTKAKYVNLNPETAFGPEVVESFELPVLSLGHHAQIKRCRRRLERAQRRISF
jgi:general secretion pathway protein D